MYWLDGMRLDAGEAMIGGWRVFFCLGWGMQDVESGGLNEVSRRLGLSIPNGLS